MRSVAPSMKRVAAVAASALLVLMPTASAQPLGSAQTDAVRIVCNRTIVYVNEAAVKLFGLEE